MTFSRFMHSGNVNICVYMYVYICFDNSFFTFFKRKSERNQNQKILRDKACRRKQKPDCVCARAAVLLAMTVLKSPLGQTTAFLVCFQSSVFYHERDAGRTTTKQKQMQPINLSLKPALLLIQLMNLKIALNYVIYFNSQSINCKIVIYMLISKKNKLENYIL